MRIPPFKKLQAIGVITMAVALYYAGSTQSMMMFIGSLMVLAGLCGRMYFIHLLFRLPTSNTVLRYLLIPVSAFLITNTLLGYQPTGISPGMWFYLQIWIGAVLGISAFIHSFTRRLMALPWPGAKQK